MMQIAPYLLIAVLALLVIFAYVARHKRTVTVKLIFSKWFQIEASAED